MKTNKFIYGLLIATVVLPVISFAALDGVKGLLTASVGILNLTLRVLFALGLVYFFWGMAQFILHSGDQKTRAEGQQRMLWGIIALFVMITIYGILVFIGSLIGISVSSSNTVTLPGEVVNCSTPGAC